MHSPVSALQPVAFYARWSICGNACNTLQFTPDRILTLSGKITLVGTERQLLYSIFLTHPHDRDIAQISLPIWTYVKGQKQTTYHYNPHTHLTVVTFVRNVSKLITTSITTIHVKFISS